MTAALIVAVALLPSWEMRTVERTADAYGLTTEQRALMVAIRRAENGAAPYYFGVADRRANTYERQARWTANTIRRRYFGDLPTFAARWCPANTAVWLRNVRWFMKRQGVKK